MSAIRVGFIGMGNKDMDLAMELAEAVGQMCQ